MSYKLIRELNKYEQDEDIPASGYLLAASNPDNTPAEETFRMSVKDVVSQYNREVAKEQAEKLASGDSLLGSTFSQIEIVNGQEIIVDATPITAANIDTLVDPGSGLEVVEICYDAGKQQVPCTINGAPNPAVKYKQKKLSFAKSSASKHMYLHINRDTGIDYLENKGEFKVDSNGIVQQRFTSINHAFKFLNNEVVSTTMTLHISLETDTEEPWFYGNGYMNNLPFKKINVYGAGDSDQNLRKVHIKHGVGVTLVDPSAVAPADLDEMNNQWNSMQQFRHGQYRARATTANPNPTDQATLPTGVRLRVHACCVFWCQASIYWRGIHFVGELHGDSIFAFYRQVAGDVHFAQCKFSVKSYERPDITNGIPATSATKAGVSHFFDIREGSGMHIQNISDGTNFQDYSGIQLKGIDTSGLELDLAQVSFIDNMFLLEGASFMRLIEYQSWAHAVDGQADRTFPCRCTITSAVPQINRWFMLTSGSTVHANAPFVIANGVSASDVNINHGLGAIGFNTIRMNGYTDENGDSQPHVIPGNKLLETKMENGIEVPVTTVDVDYTMETDVLAGIGTMKFYEAYYDNYTDWEVY